MKKLVYFILLLPSMLLAQVGVNNSDPKASLDITASNVATPANNDGILIPRVDNFPGTPPTVDQNGMLIFTTGAGTPTKGFYYWDNSITAWVPLLGAKRIDDLTDGKSDVDGSEDGSSVYLGINTGDGDDSSDNKNVGVGFQVLQNGTTAENSVGVGYRALQINTGIRNTAVGHTALVLNTSGKNNTAIGGQALASNATGDSNVAIGAFSLANNTVGKNNDALGNQSLRMNVFGDGNVAMGDYAGRALDLNNITDVNNDDNVYLGHGAGNSDRNASQNVYIGFNAGAGDYDVTANTGTLEDKSRNVFIGANAGYNETNSDRLYIENSNAGQNGALIYGRFDIDLLRVNGTLQVGNPSATSGYAFPVTDGTANQVLTTDGSGAVTWQDAVSSSNMSIVRATITANQSLNTTAWTKVNFSATDFDLNSDFDATNHVFNVPADGIYRITAMYTSDATINSADTFGIRITKNGAGPGTSNLQEVNYKHMRENSKVVRQVSTLAQLSTGNTIEVQATANVASVITIDSTSRLTSFSVERVK